jgi:hypothetical protein
VWPSANYKCFHEGSFSRNRGWNDDGWVEVCIWDYLLYLVSILHHFRNIILAVNSMFLTRYIPFLFGLRHDDIFKSIAVKQHNVELELSFHDGRRYWNSAPRLYDTSSSDSSGTDTSANDTSWLLWDWLIYVIHWLIVRLIHYEIIRVKDYSMKCCNFLVGFIVKMCRLLWVSGNGMLDS